MRFQKLTLACVMCLTLGVAADGAAPDDQGGKSVQTPSSRRGKRRARKPAPRPAPSAPSPTQGYLADEEARSNQEFFVNFYTSVLEDNGVELTTPGLIQGLGNQFHVVRIAAAHLLGLRGERSAVPALRNLLTDKEPSVRVKVAEVLVRLGDSSEFATLVREFASKDRDIRLSVVSASGAFAATDKKAEVVNLLVGALRDREKNIRAAAAGALGELGDRSAVPALRQALGSESDELTRSVIEQQLRRLGQ